MQKKRGGYRLGAGRKQNTGKFKEPTKSIRVPLSVLGPVTEWLSHLQQLIQSNNSMPFVGSRNHLTSAFHSSDPVEFPFYDCSVSAGFPSPADDSVSTPLDLNKHLVKNAPATFFVRASGESMLDAGIHDGDLLVVDRSLTAKHQDIVIAAVNGDLTVKRLLQNQNKTILKAENPKFSNIELTPDMAVHVWGVVTNVIRNLRS